jgi:histidine ammonia-lyase
MTAARAIELRGPLAPAPATAAAVAALRDAGIAGPGPDRFLAPELARAAELVRGGALLAAVEAPLGKLR